MKSPTKVPKVESAPKRVPAGSGAATASADAKPRDPKQHKLEVLRAKVRVIARMNRIFRTLRSNQNEILEIKKMAPDGKVPIGTLIGGATAIHAAYQKFHMMKIKDYKNEGFPKDSRRLSLKTKKTLHMGAAGNTE